MKRLIGIFLSLVLLTGFCLTAAAESAHDAPIVFFVNPVDGETCSKEALAAVDIFAEAADGYSIAEVEIFADFVSVMTLTAPPYTADLSGISAGRHYLSVTVSDNDGCSSSEKIRIMVEGEQSLKTIYENDLSGYVSSGSTPVGGSGSFGPDKRGSATITSVTDPDKYGEEHGVVAEIISKGESAADGHGAWFQLNPVASSSLYVEEFDLYIKDVPSSFNFAVRDISSSTLSTDVIIKPTGISFVNATADNKSYNFEENPGWYHCVYQVNIAQGTYSFSITRDGESEPLASTEDSAQRAIFPDIQGFRFSISVVNGETTDAAFDNLRISVGAAEPLISDIVGGVNTGCEMISPEEISVKIYTNNVLNESTVSADTVQLYRGETPVVIDSVSYENGVVIKLKEKLRPSTAYRVVLSGEIADSSGSMIGNELVSSFVTGYALQDADSLSLESDSEGSYVTGIMIDSEGGGKTMYAVLTVLNGDRLTDMTVKEILWENGGSFRTDSVTVKEGDTIEFALWDSFVCPNVLPKELDYE